MPPQTIDQRVDALEQRVTAIEELPARIDALGTQILETRRDMHAEFSAIRGDITAIRSDLTGVHGELAAIRGDLTGVHGELAAIRGDLTGVHGELADIRGNLGGVHEQLRIVQEEFTLIRGGERTADTPSLRSLKDDILNLGETLREEMRQNGDRILTQVRVLHEDLVSRISAIGETTKRRRRRG